MEKETAVYHPTLKAALAAYEQARLDGLCHDGAWECALETVRSLPPDSPDLRRQMVALLRHQIQSE
ncbi:MAG: hypothetical protein R6X32_02705 [Chloroflexota bacterium]